MSMRRVKIDGEDSGPRIRHQAAGRSNMKRICVRCDEPTYFAKKHGDVWVCDSCEKRILEAVKAKRARERAPSEEMREAFKNSEKAKRTGKW